MANGPSIQPSEPFNAVIAVVMSLFHVRPMRWGREEDRSWLPGGQFNRIIENLFEILVIENLIEKYFLVLKSQKDFQTDFQQFY